jgi:hypothetical protein
VTSAQLPLRTTNCHYFGLAISLQTIQCADGRADSTVTEAVRFGYSNAGLWVDSGHMR